MTYKALFEKKLGKTAVKKLPSKWIRHIARIDALPKPVKVISAKQLRELVSA